MPEVFRFYGFSFFFYRKNTSRYTFMSKARTAWQNSIGTAMLLF